jgi:hypothetical protein
MKHVPTFLRIALMCCVLVACSRTPPEQALRRSIDAMRLAVESRDASALADGVAQDFIGPEGMDRTAVRRLAQVVFLRNRSVGATVGPLDIAMREGGATVKFTAALTGSTGGLLPQSGQVYDVRTDWRQNGDEWELVAAEWTPKL